MLEIELSSLQEQQGLLTVEPSFQLSKEIWLVLNPYFIKNKSSSAGHLQA